MSFPPTQKEKTMGTPKPDSKSKQLFDAIRDNSGITIERLREHFKDIEGFDHDDYIKTIVRRFVRNNFVVEDHNGLLETLIPEYKPPQKTATGTGKKRTPVVDADVNVSEEDPHEIPSPFENKAVQHSLIQEEDHLDDFLNTLTLKDIFTLQQRIQEYALRLLGTAT